MSMDRPWIVFIAMGLVIVAIAAAFVGIDPGLRRSVQDILGYGGPHSDESTGGRHLFHTGANIRGLKQGETYAAYVVRRDSAGSSEGFMGFPCVDTCKEIEAGYRWAERNRVADPKGCGGASWPFVEGCVAYVTRAGPRA